MKFYQILFLALLMIDISLNETLGCTIDTKASSSKDCKDLKAESGDYKYCCFIKGKYENEDISGCYPLKESQYNDMKQTIKDLEKKADTKVDKLDCKSFYLQLGLISLIFLIL